MSHFSFKESLDACLELIKPGGKGYFTGLTHAIDHDQVNRYIQENMSNHKALDIHVECAYDGLIVNID